jgi:NTE family protein
MPENTQTDRPAHPTLSPSKREEGLVLCLSGGGFRATLFHLGALRRLNELGVLPRLDVITSVSGGSILNGILAAGWRQLRSEPDGTLGRFSELVAAPIRAFCRKDIRTDLLVGTRLNPACWPMLIKDFLSVRANFLAAAYERLYEESRLSHVPPPQPGKVPRFVFCATSVQTGACWHFHAGPEGRMGDFYTGYQKTGRTTIAEAVAASSAFPPGCGALRLPVSSPDAFTRTDPWGCERPFSAKRQDLSLNDKRTIFLTDGGVYDNLGVEPVWDRFTTILISDAGRPFSSTAKCGQAAVPRLSRAAGISMEQVGAVRKRWFIERLQSGELSGTMWAINTPLEDYRLSGAQGYNQNSRRFLSGVRTDLNSFTEGEMNWPR